MNLALEVVNEENEYVVKLNGEIDVYTAPKLKEKLLPIAEKNNITIKIDLAKTTYIDSTGLGVFISAYKKTQENNSKLELIHVNDRVLRLFKVTGLDRIMHIQEDSTARGNSNEWFWLYRNKGTS